MHVVALLCLAALVPAESRGQVVILRPLPASALVTEASTRLTAELRASGFSVRVLERAPRSKVLAYEAGAVMALDPAPLAALSVFEEEGDLAAALWRVDAQTRKPTAWRVSVRGERDQETASAPAVLAVRAVELLHASLTGVELDAPKLFPVAPPPVAVRAAPVAEEPDLFFARGLTVAAGMTVLHGLGGIGPSAAPVLAIGGGSRDGALVRLSLVAFGSQPSVEGEGGTASVRQETMALDLGWTFRGGQRLQPLVFAGAGAYRARVEGRAMTGYRANQDDYWAALAKAGAGLAIRVAPRLALVAEAEAMIVAPPLRVRISGAEVGDAGRPTVRGGLALQVGL